VYDGWVYIGSNNLANMELDLNQVLENGDVMIYSFNAPVTAGTGSMAPVPVAKLSGCGSSAACNPKDWSANTWHHVQNAYFAQ